MNPYTIDPIRTVEDYRAAQKKLQSLFTMCEACSVIEGGYRAEGNTAKAEAAADQGERFSEWAEDLSDALAAARARNGWGAY